MTEKGQEKALICEHCGHPIEWCAFCDRDDCPVAECYGCVTADLSEGRTSLHEHGG